MHMLGGVDSHHDPIIYFNPTKAMYFFYFV